MNNQDIINFKNGYVMTQNDFDFAIEASVLATLIFDNTLVDKHHQSLKKNIFYYPFHRKINNVILELYAKNIEIHELTIKNYLKESEESDFIELLATTPLSNVDTYIKILFEMSKKRDLVTQLSSIQLKANNLSFSELQEELSHSYNNMVQQQDEQLLEIDNIEKVKEGEAQFICKNWLPIPKKTVSLITAPGGTGKSWLLLQFAIRALLNYDAKNVFLWLSEDPKEITKHRFNKIYDQILNLTDDKYKKHIDISDSPTLHIVYEDNRKLVINSLFQQLKFKLQKYDLIILDPLIAFYGTDENNNAHARKFMQLFTDWANKENKTIIFIHHSTKNSTQSRGASAFVDAVRLVYEIDIKKDKEGKNIQTSKRVVKLTKDNYGASKYTDGFEFERVVFPNENKQNKPATIIEYPSDF